ncbi:fatty acid synthesis plsX protein [Catenuloplanes japonicus]|uniref:fatty acid synthesis plsX protein n=1 Tax=Catenuloplanes japonicus TaxID=33876 RepID=UPI00068A0573|nr:fatty acid synthesis plsX protein [Catenuloplanes japonicus]
MPGASAPPAEPGTARIAVDLLGGDSAPAVVVDGALRSCRADSDLHLLLVGPSEVADEIIHALPPNDRDRVSVRGARRAVGMSDSPVSGGRADTTVRAAAAAVAEGHADAMTSAGPSGAIVTAAVLGFGRLPGIRRPALAAILPAAHGPVLLLDVGASIESSPATLVQHGLLGAAYASAVMGLSAPRLGLLSIGTEPGKGDHPRRAADVELTGRALPGAARYAGLVEGYEISTGELADVVVTDGFTGNVLLKGVEGALGAAALEEPPPRAGVLLGIGGTVVVCHGAATGADLASGIALAADLHRRAATAAMCDLIRSES